MPTFVVVAANILVYVISSSVADTLVVSSDISVITVDISAAANFFL